MQLSRTVEYALHATLQLARCQSGMPIPNSQLATNGVMPQRFLLQVLRHLVTHGLLHSTRGVDGGYTLARDPSKITLLDVVEAVEGPLVLKQPSSQTLSEPTWSALRATLDRGVQALSAEYATLTLAQILSDFGPAPVRVQTPAVAKKRRERPVLPIGNRVHPPKDVPSAPIEAGPQS